ncbi:quinone-dependent dihydroorotate dehydrogenase [Lewinella cohaerens]|uniref:quinone-dependent dihydroorotate dehydrogenase n=1 Tax=Lewinella cohaerens TaxID=70995 RepID=UPI00037360C6|nr:quinone-dependent dihydroorotate dehydrogenase [Lewinella cohaerens]
MLYTKLLKPLLFRLAPEQAHHLTVKLLETSLMIPGVSAIMRNQYHLVDTRLRRQCFGIDFPNPVGLAAGFDKDGRYFHAMSNLGFGFIEIGTVTPRPQGGNPQPRLFRLPKDKALINRMGFNNEGVDALVERLKKGRPEGVVIGGNIGKNKDTPNEKATDDYLICFEKLFPYVDYFVVNVSSPNTPNLRDLQEKEPLTKLLSTLQQRNKEEASPKPILLKIAPDLTDGQLDDILEIAKATELAGIIATNTTISREGLETNTTEVSTIGNGGLSGAPLRKRATEVIRYLAEHSKGELPIVGVGGITSGQDAVDKLAAGACLIQVYSGLIYAGPTLVKDICKAVLAE